MNKTKNYPLLIVFLVFGFIMIVSSGFGFSQEKGVYEYVIQKCDQSLDEATAALEEAIQNSPFKYLTKFDEAVPAGCTHKTRVLIFYDPSYATKVLGANKRTGPFAIVDRINLFEDEQGLHVAFVNPANILRTVLLDDTQYARVAEEHRLALRTLISECLTGTVTEKQFGPIRKKGYIGRTMGVMAGGPFDKKVENVLVAPGESLKERVEILKAEIQKKQKKWDLNHIYSLILEDEGIAVVGVSSPSIESKSFSIVKAGGDKSRKKLSHPGLAHAAAYPIEIVLEQKQNVYWARIVDAMFRMKMYFEDAGKMAFAKNMGMPGSIEKEMRTIIKNAFQSE